MSLGTFDGASYDDTGDAGGDAGGDASGDAMAVIITNIKNKLTDLCGN